MTATTNDLNTLMAEIGQKLQEKTRTPPRKRMVEISPEEKPATAVFPEGQARMIRERIKVYEEREEAFAELHRIDQAEDPELKAKLLGQFLTRYPNHEELDKQADDARRMFAWTWHEKDREKTVAKHGVLPWRLVDGQPPPVLPERRKRPVTRTIVEAPKLDEAEFARAREERREREKAIELRKRIEAGKREHAGRIWAAKQLAMQMAERKKEALQAYFEELTDLPSYAWQTQRQFRSGYTGSDDWRDGNRKGNGNAKPIRHKPWQAFPTFHRP